VSARMDQHEQQDTHYEAPVVEDVEVAEGPASVVAGIPATPLTR
jgi:hypothetical protein